MSDRLEFREKLGGILQKAQGAQNVLSAREVEEYFAEDGLSREWSWSATICCRRK